MFEHVFDSDEGSCREGTGQGIFCRRRASTRRRQASDAEASAGRRASTRGRRENGRPPPVQTTVSNAGFSGQGLTRNLAPGADDGTRNSQRVTGNLERNAELPAEAAQADQQ